METYINHYGIIQNILLHKDSLCTVYHVSTALPPPPSKSITTTDPFIVSIILPYPECHILRIIQYTAFSHWLLSGNNLHLMFLHVFSSLLSGWLFIHLPTEKHLDCS